MDAPLTVHIGSDAVEALVADCARQGLRHLVLVADAHTYAALGQEVQRALEAGGARVTRVLLEGDEVIADEAHLVQLLLAAPAQEPVYLAVGSGTITDIVRLVSHRTRAAFISMPTAPSVDGYASVNAPLVLGRFKRTVNAQGPQAIYAHLPTLCAAPRPMIAAGFGDMLGKHTSLADWRLGHLLWDEPYDASVAAETAGALARCEAHIEGIRRAEPEGIRALTEALIVSGLAMLRFGDSRPASGAEHHLSHYWEMRLLIEGRPALLHGAKVGVACVRMAERYRALAHLSIEEVATQLRATRYMPGTAKELDAIREAYGEIADEIIAYHQPFLGPSAHDLSAVCERIVEHWPEVQAIARTVPLPSTLAGQLRTVGGPATVAELGLRPEEGVAAEAHAHYLRPRFTVLKLAKLLGLPPGGRHNPNVPRSQQGAR